MKQIVTWPYFLRRGHSEDPSKGACAMDAINWLVHGVHGDHPACASPAISSFVMKGNDSMPDDTRQRLLAFLPRIAGSRSEAHEEARVAIMVIAAQRWAVVAATEAATAKWSAAAAAATKAAATTEAAKWSAEAAAEAATAKWSEAVAAARRAAWAAAAATEAAAAATAKWSAEAAKWAAEAAAAAKWAAWAAAAEKWAEAAGWAARAAKWAAWAAAAHSPTEETVVWNDYYAVLDAVLNAGPQGEPWSADALDTAVHRYAAAGGVGVRSELV